MNNTRKTFLVLFFFLCISGFIIVFWGYYQLFQEMSQADGAEIEQLWSQGQLDEIITLTSEKLKQNSLSFQLLRYNAYAYFYLALAQSDTQKRFQFLNNSIHHLRKALLIGYPNENVKAEMYYVLGKAYYYHQLVNLPLALKYLKKAISLKHSAKDSYEFLADAYQQMGQDEKSLEFFAGVYERNPTSPQLLLAYGKSLLAAQEYILAERILKKARENSQNQLLLVQVLFQLAQVYYNEGSWQEAKNYLDEVIETQASPEAHFLLGEIYNSLDQPIQARKEWRQTLKLDNQHQAAYERLQK